MSLGEINAKEKEAEEKSETNNIGTIHLGIFFDGTANNMVQQALYNDVFTFNVTRKTKFKGSEQVFKEKDEYDFINYKMKLNGYVTDEELKKFQRLKDNKSDKNLEFEVEEQELMEDTEENGYSNIAVLYSLFKDRELQVENDIAHKFYIEGSGANDISHMGKSNINGLGFGLGLTGVTALVSKGVRAVTNYLNSLSARIDNTTKVKFYIFGFSRGATCARLFSHLITRESSGDMPREDEFSKHIANYCKKNSVYFLQKENPAFQVKNLPKDNISIEYLGIYDTVASIGLLKQKDGWSDPLGWLHQKFPNYKNNWHFKNVFDYGLYIDPKIKNVCHIGALDEFRENFAFTNIGKNVPSNAVEILVPGCHSDIGGGYATKVEKEIEIDRYTTKKNKKIRTHLPLKSYTAKPRHVEYISMPGQSLPLSNFEKSPFDLRGLKELGWIYFWETEKGIEIPKVHSETGYTISCEEKEKKGGGQVYFKRFVSRGWSDVTLAMLIQNCKECGTDIFRDPAAYDYKSTIINSTVKEIADNCISKSKGLGKGKRFIMSPGALNCSKYQTLREYIHFTSSSSILHKSRQGLSVEGEMANFGNKPNFDLDGVLCRISYNGDKEQFGDGDYAEAVNYMYDLKFEEIRI